VDIPYVKMSEVATHRRKTNKESEVGFTLADYSYSMSNGVLVASQSYNNATYSIYFDSNTDSVYSDYLLDAIDYLHSKLPLRIIKDDTSPIAKCVSEERKPTAKRTTFSFAKYNIDLYAYDNEVLLPFAFVNALFFSPQFKDFIYNGKAIFLTSDAEVTSKYYSLYNSYLTSEKNQPRNEATAKMNRNLTLFLMDSFYGRFNETTFKDFTSLSKSLGVYDDLASSTPMVAYAALAKLLCLVDDIHSSPNHPSSCVASVLGTDSVDQEYQSQVVTKINGTWRGRRREALEEVGGTLSTNLVLDDQDQSSFSYSGDTAIIRFESFARKDNDKVFLPNHVIGNVNYQFNSYNLFYDAFKDIKANHSEVKNIIVDLSANLGGTVITLVEIAGFFMSKVPLTYTNQLTGEVFHEDYEVDTNYDGVYDDNDFQAKGYNVYCLISGSSFSCGNLLPEIFKVTDSATIIGQTSAGGSCVVYNLPTGTGDLINLSGPHMLGEVSEDGTFLSNDNGVVPSIHIPLDNYYKIDKLLTYLPA
jgi:hypothetical protein